MRQNAGERWDAGWVDSLASSSDLTAVSDPTADFTLVMPDSTLLCPEKMIQGNYLCTRTYNTGASFELISMKFACLMRVHPWVNSIVFGNNRPHRTTNMGENVPPKPVFCFHSAGMEFFMEKTYKQYLVPHSPQKKFSPFLSSNVYFASKMVMSPKKYFSRLFWKIWFFFWKNFSMKNI